MFRRVQVWQVLFAFVLGLPLSAGVSLGQDFYFGNFEEDVQFNGQYILDQTATGYAGWFDWAYQTDPPENPPRATYSPVTPETTYGVTTGTYSLPWRPAGPGFDQGLAVNVQDLPAATRDALFAGFFNNTHLAINVTWNNDDWFLAFNGTDWNGNEIQMYANYGGTSTQFVPLGMPDGRPDIDTGNPGEHRGRWDIENYEGVHTRVMMWDYSAIKDEIQAQYTAGTLNETNGTLEFVMSTSHGNFDLGANPPFTSPPFYIDSWRFTSPNPAEGGLANYQLPDAPTWPGSPVHVTTTTSTNLQVDFNTEATIGIGGGVSHTFTPTETVTLDGFAIRAAGAPTTGEMYLYRNPIGGSEADGFVNNAFNEGILIEALPYTFFGTDNRAFLVFDLLDGAEVTLEAGVEYSIDLRNTGEGEMYWMRSTTEPFLNAYTGGNIYARNPLEIGDEGERFDVAGGGRRDGTLALYAELPPPMVGIPGDYNGDGRVDGGDYVRWRNHLGDADETNINNNGDGGDVGISDYAFWKERYGNPPGGGGLTSTVPEPATLSAGLLAIAVLGVLRYRIAN